MVRRNLMLYQRNPQKQSLILENQKHIKNNQLHLLTQINATICLVGKILVSVEVDGNLFNCHLRFVVQLR